VTNRDELTKRLILLSQDLGMNPIETAEFVSSYEECFECQGKDIDFIKFCHLMTMVNSLKALIARRYGCQVREH